MVPTFSSLGVGKDRTDNCVDYGQECNLLLTTQFHRRGRKVRNPPVALVVRASVSSQRNPSLRSSVSDYHDTCTGCVCVCISLSSLFYTNVDVPVPIPPSLSFLVFHSLSLSILLFVLYIFLL